MTEEALHYVGGELDLFAAARNWRAYWTGQVRPFLGREVLEVGAGIGSATEALWHPGVAAWLALEPDEALRARLAERVARMGAPSVAVGGGTVAGLPPEARFDSALYIDVLEHIEDDAGEMARVARHIRAGGHIVVLAPAHGFLFTAFDRAIGHHRRYDRAGLARLAPPGFAPVCLRYLDAVGMFASLGNRLLLRSAAPTPGQIAFWDGWMVPLSRRLDRLLGYRVGKSVLGVWRREAGRETES